MKKSLTSSSVVLSFFSHIPCCILPIIGLHGSFLGTAFSSILQPLFILLNIIILSIAWYSQYKKQSQTSCNNSCTCPKNKLLTLINSNIYLIILSLLSIVSTVIFFSRLLISDHSHHIHHLH